MPEKKKRGKIFTWQQINSKEKERRKTKKNRGNEETGGWWKLCENLKLGDYLPMVL